MAAELGDVVAQLDHPQRAVGRRLPRPRRGDQGAGHPRLADGAARLPPPAALARAGAARRCARSRRRARRDHAEPARSPARSDEAARPRCGWTATSTAGSWTRCLRGRYPEDMLEHYERRYGPLDVVRDGDLEAISRADRLPRRQLLQPAARALGSDAPPLAGRAGGARSRRPPRWAGRSTPTGCTSCSCACARDYGDLPIYITENGAAFDDGRWSNGASRTPARRLPAAATSVRCRAGGRRRRRRAPLLRLVAARQLRVGAGLRQALRARPRRLRDAAARAQAQRALVPRLHRARPHGRSS